MERNALDHRSCSKVWKLSEPLEVEVGQELPGRSDDRSDDSQGNNCQLRIEYKYVLIRGTKRDKLRWEAEGLGNHRRLRVTEAREPWKSRNLKGLRKEMKGVRHSKDSKALCAV